MNQIKGDAVFSPCGLYRYSLTRKLDNPYGFPCLFVMLNPSTAYAVKNDPTVRRCMLYANKEQFSSLTVVNLFAYRAANPKKLLSVEDSTGPDNKIAVKAFIEYTKRENGFVVFGWGAFPLATKYWVFIVGTEVKEAYCLGKTKDGLPQHPLYVPDNQKLERWL